MADTLLIPDAAWQHLEPIFAPDPPGPRAGRPRRPNRAVLDAILTYLINGQTWRKSLPPRAGRVSHMTCRRRLGEWQRDGTWPKLQQVCLLHLPHADQIDWGRAICPLPATGARPKAANSRVGRSRVQIEPVAPVMPAERTPAPSGLGHRSEEWLATGHRLRDARQRDRARDAYRAAAETAGDDRDRRARAVASEALCCCQMDNLLEARTLAKTALNHLGIADLRPEAGVSVATIRSRLGDEVALDAYATVAETLAYVHYTRERFQAAEASAQTFEAISEVLGDPLLVAGAKHIRGKCRVAMGAELHDHHEHERAWRTVRDEASVRLGIEDLQVARSTRSTDDLVGFLKDFHQEGKALLLLGDRKGAAAAGDAARELFGRRWTPIEVPMDEARRAIFRGQRKQAQEHLLEMLDLAWQTKAYELHARSLIGLAELGMERGSRDEVLGFAIAAALMWPFDLSEGRHRDFRRIERLLRRRLRPSRNELENAIDYGKFPFDGLVGAPHTVSLAHQSAILDRLQRAPVGPGS